MTEKKKIFEEEENINTFNFIRIFNIKIKYIKYISILFETLIYTITKKYLYNFEKFIVFFEHF